MTMLAGSEVRARVWLHITIIYYFEYSLESVYIKSLPWAISISSRLGSSILIVCLIAMPIYIVWSFSLTSLQYGSPAHGASSIHEEPSLETFVMEHMIALQRLDFLSICQFIDANTTIMDVSSIKVISLIGNGIELSLSDSTYLPGIHLYCNFPDHLLSSLQIYDSS
jgi:hypothetical protein